MTKAWRGGVQPQVNKRHGLQRSTVATIVKRAPLEGGVDKVRLRTKLRAEVGDILIVDAEYESLAADVIAIYPAHDLVDARLLASMDSRVMRVHLRKRVMP